MPKFCLQCPGLRNVGLTCRHAAQPVRGRGGLEFRIGGAGNRSIMENHPQEGVLVCARVDSRSIPSRPLRMRACSRSRRLESLNPARVTTKRKKYCALTGSSNAPLGMCRSWLLNSAVIVTKEEFYGEIVLERLPRCRKDRQLTRVLVDSSFCLVQPVGRITA